MDKFIEVIRRVLDLSDTCLEALEHFKMKVAAGQYEQNIELFNDIVGAFYQMEKSIKPMLKEESSALSNLTTDLRQAIDQVVGMYEQSRFDQMAETVDNQLLPSFTNWKQTLEEWLQPYRVS